MDVSEITHYRHGSPAFRDYRVARCRRPLVELRYFSMNARSGEPQGNDSQQEVLEHAVGVALEY